MRKNDPFDHAPLVKAWLDEPIWLPPSDTGRIAQLVHQTPQQRGWLRPSNTSRSVHTMFSATKFIVAGAFVALFGGFILSGALTPRGPDQLPPAAQTASPGPQTASPAPESASPAPTTAAPSESPAASEPTESAVPADAIVMDPGTGRSVAGWTEVGRVSTARPEGRGSVGQMRQLEALGDRLVALGSITARRFGGQRDFIFHSVDGLTWLPATIPGDGPEVSDIAPTVDGLMASGSEVVDGERTARLWSTSDGVEWTPLAAPPARRIGQIVSATEPLAVVAGQRLWVSRDGGEWTQGTRLVNMSILRGPGGFLAWQGGGQDLTIPTVMIHSTDLTEWNEVGLPRPLTRGDDAFAGISVFALDDRWVLIPSPVKLPDTIYTSADGLDWQEAPRPPRMDYEDLVFWVARVGDQVQAFGTARGDQQSSPRSLWRWELGQPAGDPLTSDETGNESFSIGAPVAFQGGYVAAGSLDDHLVLWRFEPTGS